MPQHADKRELIEAWGTAIRRDDSGRDRRHGRRAGGSQRRAAFRSTAISNWSAETFPPQRERFPFLSWFDDLVISGVEGVIKPDPRIFRILLERNAIAPESAVFIDDVARNADAATRLGIHGIHFRSPAQLRRELAAVGLLPEGP